MSTINAIIRDTIFDRCGKYIRFISEVEERSMASWASINSRKYNIYLIIFNNLDLSHFQNLEHFPRFSLPFVPQISKYFRLK